MLELNPNFWGVHWGLGHVYRANGDYKQAIAAFQRSVDAKGGHLLPLPELGHTWGVMGKRKQAQAVLDQLDEFSDSGYVSPYYYATVHAGLDDADQVFEWLEKAYRQRSRSLAWIKVAREFQPLSSDARFVELVARVGIPENPPA
jgi:tetratricopeptide (TPR) repeat protein